MDRLPWARWHWMVVIGLGTAWILRRFIDDVFLAHRHTADPVVGMRGDLIGLLAVRDVLELRREQWSTMVVRDRMLPVERSLVVDAEEPLDAALRDLARTEVHRALVSDHGHSPDRDCKRVHNPSAMATRKLSPAGPATLRDVARVAGVHPGTVSRALNPQTRGLVNERTARRVMAAAEELAYRPNPIARGLRTNRSHTIGVLVPDLMNPLFAAVVRGIEDGLREGGYTPLIANTDNDAERERVAYEAMSARQVDGFIAATAVRDHWLLPDQVSSGAKVVLINRRVDGDTVPAVTGDDHEGIRLAVEHLAELGHRRIAHVAGPQGLYTGWCRHHGFLDAMQARKLELDPALIVPSAAFTPREGARCCAQLLERRREFTAIVAASDLLVLGCYDVLEQRGMSCPQDLSIVGYNDLPFVDRFRPPLTTVRIPHYEMGTTAAELMLEQVRELDPPARQLELAPKLVVRESTAPAVARRAAKSRVRRRR